MNHFFDPLLQQFPDCHIDHKDAASVHITSPGSDGVMMVEIMVHRYASGGFSATRYEEGMVLQAGDLAHAWVTLRDAHSQFLHHEVICAPDRLLQLLAEWRAKPEPAPSVIQLTPIKAAKISTGDSASHPVIHHTLDLSLLDGLPDASAAAAQLQADLAKLDPVWTVQSWPRDDRGRLAARTTVILAAYGPASRKRQPCLLMRSNMQSQMPGWQLLLSQEFLYNHRHQWSNAPWLWADKPTQPKSRQAQSATKLISQGKISEAGDLCDVRLGDPLRKLAAGMRWQRFESAPEAWVHELQAALLQLAPWRLAVGLQRIQQHLNQCNRKPPKPGSWERKLFWFSGQRQQVRWGLGAGLDAQGKPWLDLIATASNEHLPEPDWKQ